MRQQNAGVVLQTIRQLGPISRPDIARATGLSKPTVTNVVRLLTELGYLFEKEFTQKSDRPKARGPRPKLVTFNSRMGYVIGIDTGADNTVGKVADLAGNVIATHRRKHSDPPRREAVLADIRSVVVTLLEMADLGSDDVRAAVLGTPGVVDPDSGEITLAPQIEGWDGINLATALNQQFTCPIIIENESHLSLLAERWQGAARKCRNALFVQLGIGIGGALLLDGEIYRGSSGAAGEIAYLSLDNTDETPPAGSSIGAFEWYAGGQAYRRHAAEVVGEPEGKRMLELGGGQESKVTARVVFRAAKEGDPAAIAIMERLLTRLGRGLANLATAMDPELIIIAGGVSNAGDIVLPTVQEVVNQVVPRGPTVTLSELGDKGTVIGAVKRALEIVDQEIYTTFTHRSA